MKGRQVFRNDLKYLITDDSQSLFRESGTDRMAVVRKRVNCSGSGEDLAISAEENGEGGV